MAFAVARNGVAGTRASVLKDGSRSFGLLVAER